MASYDRDDPWYVLDLQDFAKSSQYGGRLSGRHPSSQFQDPQEDGKYPNNDDITADLPSVMGIGGVLVAAAGAEFDAISINDEDDDEEEVDPRQAARITQVPTSTINSLRPRTIAAGYNPKTNIMTVIFRDGTWWNYPQVKSLEWSNFKRAYSKGRYLIAHGFQDGNRVGGKGQAADVGAIDPQERAILAMRARAVQVASKGITNTQSMAGLKKAQKRSVQYGKGNLGGTGRARNKR